MRLREVVFAMSDGAFHHDQECFHTDPLQSMLARKKGQGSEGFERDRPGRMVVIRGWSAVSRLVFDE
jgi:hypothetical protein